ncbi:hypothetical protein Tco_0391786, partial [Tanacetum coccineum]
MDREYLDRDVAVEMAKYSKHVVWTIGPRGGDEPAVLWAAINGPGHVGPVGYACTVGVFGTLDYGMQLHVSSTTQLSAYTDVDWAGCPVTRR